MKTKAKSKSVAAKSKSAKVASKAKGKVIAKAKADRPEHVGLQYSDSAKIKAMPHKYRDPNSAVAKRFAKVRVGMTVAKAREFVSGFDLACAINRGRIVITGAKA